jgi:hypothetical protein
MRNALPYMAAILVNLCGAPATASDYVLHTFKKLQLTDKFWSEAAVFADINRDGHNDVIAGPYWYEGPDFKQRHEYYPATQTFTRTNSDGSAEIVEGFEGALGSGKTLAYSDNGFAQVLDLNGDGWPDLLIVGYTSTINVSRSAAYWYENPGKHGLETGVMWKRHLAADGVDNQSLAFIDLFGDGQPVLLGMSGGQSGRFAGQVGYFRPDPKNPTNEWEFHPISWRVDEFQFYTHGLGYGDVNGDGRNDVLHSDGWWEQPASLVNEAPWAYHPYPFNLGPGQIKQNLYREASDPLRVAIISDIGPDGVVTPITIYGGSQMHVYDVNADGMPDIVTSLTASGYGLAWWEQLKHRDRFGNARFRRHIILNKEPKENKYGIEFSEMQAVALVDLDGDGLKDIVTGKRFWVHGNVVDPESDAPAVLYWFKLVRNADKNVDFVPYLIDNDSGAGCQITVGDVNGDGLPDIVVANKKGAFVFFHEEKRVNKQEWTKAQPRVKFPGLTSALSH